jgi:hypothetical protein
MKIFTFIRRQMVPLVVVCALVLVLSAAQQ